MGLLLGLPLLNLQQPPPSAPSTVSSQSVDFTPRPLSISQQSYFEVVLGRSFAAIGYPLPDNQLAHLVSLFLDSGFGDLRDIGAEREISAPISTSSPGPRFSEYRMPNPTHDSSPNAARISSLLPFRYRPAQRQLPFSTSASRPTSNTSSNVYIEEEEEAPRSPPLSKEEDMNTDDALRQELLNHVARFRENLIGIGTVSIEIYVRWLAQPTRVGEELIHIGEGIISGFKEYEDHVESIARQLLVVSAAMDTNGGRGGAQWRQIIDSQNAAFEAAHAEMCKIVRAQDRMRALIRIRKQELGI